jgi:urease accessory protein
VLTGRRFTLPLQALEPMDLTGDGSATLLLLNPTGGVLGGDRLDTEVSLGPGSRVCLSTPSATRVYRSPERPAVQRVSIGLGRGAALEWLPDHLIPSPGARLRQVTEVSMAADATLIYLDAWATGRAARGEAWGFDLLDTSLRVRDETGPLLRERAMLGGGAPLDGLGGTEGFAYVATLAALRTGLDGARLWADLASALERDLHAIGPDCRAGVSGLARGGVLVRLLCRSAPSLSACVDAIWARCRRRLLGLGPLGLRKL